MNKSIVLTVSMFFQVLCLQANTFTIRPAEPQDMATCIQIAKQVIDKVNRPFLSGNVDEYISKIDEKFFHSLGGDKVEQLLVAVNEGNQVIGFLKYENFFGADPSSQTWKEFVAKVKDNTLENDKAWLTKHCDGSGIYVLRLYVDQDWRGKGVGTLFLKSLKGFCPQAQRIYLDTYAGKTQACDFYKHRGFSELDHLSIGQFNEEVFFSIDINLLHAV